MAEERRERRRTEDKRGSAEQAPAVSASPQNPQKKKKRGKGSLLFLLLFLTLGSGAGLHFSGLWDARPLVWSIVPAIPYVGEHLTSLLNIPERYTLTVAERRAWELEERQKRLDERERGLQSREIALEALSGDVGQRTAKLDLQESAQRNRSQSAEESSPDAGKKLMEQVARTYQDMSPRNAAQIVEQLSEPLAVELLQKLPVDARSSILGKMTPVRAARLTEQMARERD